LAAVSLDQRNAALGRRKHLLADQHEAVQNILQLGAAEDEVHDFLLPLQQVLQAHVVRSPRIVRETRRAALRHRNQPKV
jgi:hypothetical protein